MANIRIIAFGLCRRKKKKNIYTKKMFANRPAYSNTYPGIDCSSLHCLANVDFPGDTRALKIGQSAPTSSNLYKTDSVKARWQAHTCGK